MPHLQGCCKPSETTGATTSRRTFFESQIMFIIQRFICSSLLCTYAPALNQKKITPSHDYPLNLTDLFAKQHSVLAIQNITSQHAHAIRKHLRGHSPNEKPASQFGFVDPALYGRLILCQLARLEPECNLLLSRVHAIYRQNQFSV